MISPFYLNEDHPHYTVLLEWFDKVRDLEEQIQKATRLIGSYSKLCSTYAQIQRTWPELLHFVRFKHMTSTAVSDKLVATTNRFMKPHDKEGTIELLATAVMLPEHTPMLAAWVNFYTGEQE